MARPGLEPGTPRCSGEGTEHSKQARKCLQIRQLHDLSDASEMFANSAWI
jgi:hypothetical protein